MGSIMVTQAWATSLSGSEGGSGGLRGAGGGAAGSGLPRGVGGPSWSRRWHCLLSGLRVCWEPWGWLAEPWNPEAWAPLQLDQRRQGRALARLQQRAHMEVREAEKALDGLLFQRQLEVSWPRPELPHVPAPSPGQRALLLEALVAHVRWS